MRELWILNLMLIDLSIVAIGPFESELAGNTFARDLSKDPLTEYKTRNGNTVSFICSPPASTAVKLERGKLPEDMIRPDHLIGENRTRTINEWFKNLNHKTTLESDRPREWFI